LKYDFHSHCPFDGVGVFVQHGRMFDPEVKSFTRKVLQGVEYSLNRFSVKKLDRFRRENQDVFVVGSIHSYKSGNDFLTILRESVFLIDQLGHPLHKSLGDLVTLGEVLRVCKEKKIYFELNERHIRLSETRYVERVLKSGVVWVLASDAHEERDVSVYRKLSKIFMEIYAKEVNIYEIFRSQFTDFGQRFGEV